LAIKKSKFIDVETGKDIGDVKVGFNFLKKKKKQ